MAEEALNEEERWRAAVGERLAAVEAAVLQMSQTRSTITWEQMRALVKRNGLTTKLR